MKQINSTDFKNNFGECLALAKDEPVFVSKSGKPVAVLMSTEEYDHLQRLDDAYWLARAEVAEATGQWIGHDDVMAMLTSHLKRPE